MERVPDHPVIRELERNGYIDSKVPLEPACPVCGRECMTIYRDRDGEIVGCDDCIREIDARDVPECFRG